MISEDETVIHVTEGASWLPHRSRAEVIRRTTPPRPMCVVRLLLWQAEEVFCTTRPDTGRLDLPMSFVGPDDPDGAFAIRGLADHISGEGSRLMFEGAVKNVVVSPPDGYAWPSPHAYFGVWASQDAPVVQGVWVSIGEESPLRDRHWFPLVM